MFTFVDFLVMVGALVCASVIIGTMSLVLYPVLFKLYMKTITKTLENDLN